MKKQVIKGNIYIYYSKNRKVRRFPTGIKASDKSAYAKSKVLSVENKLRNIIEKFNIENHHNPPTSYVINEFYKEVPKAETLFEHFSSFIELKAKDPKIKPQSLNPYNTTKENLKNFVQKENKNSLIDLDINFLFDFHNYLIDVVKIGLESQKKRVNILKAFLKYLRDYDIYSCNQNLLDYTVSTNDPDDDEEIYTLTKEQLTEFYNFSFLEKFQREDLDYVKDIMVFEAMTSIRIGDILRLSDDSVTGRKINLKSQKSGRYVLKMNDTAFEIWNRYKSFNRYVDQTIFRKLRELLILCKLFDNEIKVNGIRGPERKFITSHVFRKTFITLMVMQNTPLNKLMAMTAHKKIDTLLVYINKYAPTEVEYENQIAL